MTFKKNKYQVIKNALSFELADFIFYYFLIKRDAVDFLYQKKLHPQTSILGGWEDPQVPNTYVCYGDFAMETLLLKMLPIMQQQTNLDLVPTNSFARVYKKGDELKRHKDRPSCEISATINLGGNPWPIFIEPSGEKGKEGIKVLLEVGDMLVYSGCELEHWREPFDGDICGQVFLHYNDLNGPFAHKNKFDGRAMLGLPSNRTKKSILRK
ncbi:hypothetical protein OAB00_04510 [Akkermansiaceae bacterium]|nr:hypothetical protein [Akkermansiaceae bacterium]|tara:strand:- start:95 stop:727 length:633 start_codon:yes stop_codon:yes gene_type:complete